jgi:hypothetical protein
VADDASIDQAFDAGAGEGRAAEVAEQPLQGLGVMGGDGGAGVDGEALVPGEQTGLASGSWPDRDAKRCGWLLSASHEQRVVRLAAGVADDEASDPAGDAPDQRVDF